jgi:hypothetical protein
LTARHLASRRGSRIGIAARLRRWRKAARSRQSTGRCAGGSPICASRCGTSLNRRVAADDGPRAARPEYCKLCRPARAITPRRPARSRTLKTWPATLAAVARDRDFDPATQRSGSVTRAGSARRTRSPGAGPCGIRPSAPRNRRARLTYIFGAICPKQGKAVWVILPKCNTAAMNSHLAAIRPTSPWTPRGTASRPGRLASLRQACHPRQHHHCALAGKVPEPPAGEHLATHARQLALQPRPRKRRNYCRSVLRRLEETRGPTLEDHVHRMARMGVQLLISES